jgi:hypothetical protein
VPRLSNTGAIPLFLHMLSWQVQVRIYIYFTFTTVLKDTACVIGAVLDTLIVHTGNEVLMMSLEVSQFILFIKYHQGDEINKGGRVGHVVCMPDGKCRQKCSCKARKEELLGRRKCRWGDKIKR